MKSSTGRGVKKKDMANKKRLHKNEFNQIKMFLGTGANMKKIAEILNRSYCTILRVNKTKDFETWQKQNEIFAQKIRAKENGMALPENKVESFYIKAEVAKIQEGVAHLVALIK